MTKETNKNLSLIKCEILNSIPGKFKIQIIRYKGFVICDYLFSFMDRFREKISCYLQLVKYLQ